MKDHDHEVALVPSSVICQRAADTIAHPELLRHQTSPWLSHHDFTMGLCLELVLSPKMKNIL